jgi:hypothetical protein
LGLLLGIGYQFWRPGPVSLDGRILLSIQGNSANDDSVHVALFQIGMTYDHFRL